MRPEYWFRAVWYRSIPCTIWIDSFFSSGDDATSEVLEDSTVSKVNRSTNPSGLPCYTSDNERLATPVQAE
jgi:hypothetical protein